MRSRPWLLLALLLIASRAFAHDGNQAHNDVDEKITELSNAIAQNPDDVKSLKERGYYYLVNNEFEFCAQDMERVLKLKPRYAGAAVGRGMARFSMGDMKGALEDLTADFVRSEKLAGALFYEGEVLRLLGDRALARERYEAAIKANKAFPLALARLGEARGLDGDEKGAMEAFEQALAIDPRHVPTRIARAQLYASKGRDKDARSELESLKAAWPDDARPLAAIARLERTSGWALRAEDSGREAARLFGVECEASRSHARKAWLKLEEALVHLEARKDARKALAAAEEGLAFWPRVDLARLKLDCETQLKAPAETLAATRALVARLEARLVPAAYQAKTVPGNVADVASPTAPGH
jgi:tetratricopeptide (TPR) repeat protein